MKETVALLSPRSILVGDDWKRAPRKLLVRALFERALFERALFEPIPFPAPPRGRSGHSASFSARTVVSEAGDGAKTAAGADAGAGAIGTGADAGAGSDRPSFSVEASPPASEGAGGGDFKFDAPYEAIRALLPSPRALLRFPAGYAENATSELTVALAPGDDLAAGPDSEAAGVSLLGSVPLLGAVPLQGAVPLLGAVPFAASLVIVVGENAKARVVVRYSGAPAPGAVAGQASGRAGLFLGSVEIRLERGASLEFVSVSCLGPTVRRLESRKVQLGENAKLRWTEVVFDEGSGRHETSIVLDGRGAELDYAGAWAASGTTEREHILSVLHSAEKTRSRSVLKAVLSDEARIAFRGLIEVTRSAPGTDAYLQNRNLLLDDGARAESLPQLKIDQDDVACSHGSATGGPREDELFYLMSRGLDAASASETIALGHLGSVLDRARTAYPDSCAAGQDFAKELETMAATALAGAP